MKPYLKVLGIVVLTICFLSITVKNETLFSYIYDVISPATTLAQRGTISAYEFSAEKTRAFTKKLFDNSVPKVDTVKSKLSGPSRKRRSSEAPLEKIDSQEKEELDELIKDPR